MQNINQPVTSGQNLNNAASVIGTVVTANPNPQSIPGNTNNFNNNNNPAHKKSSIPLFLMILVTSIIIFLLVGIFLFKYMKIGNASYTLPIDPQKSFIKSYGMTYYLETTLKEIRPVKEGQELIPEIIDPQLPTIILTPNTPVYRDTEKDRTFDRIDRNVLKPGQKVGVLLFHNNLTTWRTVRVTVLNDLSVDSN